MAPLDILFLVCFTVGAVWSLLSYVVTAREWRGVGLGSWGATAALRRAAVLRATLLPLFTAAGMYLVCALLMLPVWFEWPF